MSRFTLQIILLLLALPASWAQAEQYVARNADWPARLEELMRAKEQIIRNLGFEVSSRNQKVVRAEAGHDPVFRSEKGLDSEEQKDCALRQIKEVASFLKDGKYQQYLKDRKVRQVWLEIVDNAEGKLADAQMKYGPELVREGIDIEASKPVVKKFPAPVLVVRPALNSKRACVIVTYENLTFSFDWWDQGEASP